MDFTSYCASQNPKIINKKWWIHLLGCLIAKRQIYLLGNFIAQRLFTTTDDIQYILHSHAQSNSINRDALLWDFLPLSCPEQHRYMVHWQRHFEQHGKGAHQRGCSSGAELHHDSRQVRTSVASCTGKSKLMHSCTSRFSCSYPDSARLLGEAALWPQGEFSKHRLP